MTHQVSPGILTSGLGGDATTMIIGSFRLGGFTVDFAVGGGGDYPQPNFGGGRKPSEEPAKIELIFTITLPNGTRHRRRYLTYPTLVRVITTAKLLDFQIRKIFTKVSFLWKNKK